MKKFFQNLILVLILTVAILSSYVYLQNREKKLSFSEIYHYLIDHTNQEDNSSQSENKDENQKKNIEMTRSIWLSYLEFNSYESSVKNNTEENFRIFYQQIIDKCKALHMDNIIVQVRPFGDALYRSDYFPWAACISGKQGKNPGYDPLKIMTKMTHDNNMTIEAWINPFRVSAGMDYNELSDNNPAKIWNNDKETKRNVLKYNGSLYYNPSSEEVRKLITQGVQEIVANYDVDGIHMDDYFYPTFTEKNVNNAFDAKEYKSNRKNGLIQADITISQWRRNNINQLVSGIYKSIKDINDTCLYGISPAGNLDNLRSDLEYYTDIDTWVTKTGYVDYIMPQIYWGFSNEQAPFADVLSEWSELVDTSKVKLYVGLQLYRMGSDEKGQSDYAELQTSKLVKEEISALKDKENVYGYCFFSYQYLDVDNKNYGFESTEFSRKRKKILRQIERYLEKYS